MTGGWCGMDSRLESEYLARMERERRAKSVGSWILVVSFVIELALAAAAARWLVGPPDGAGAIAAGVLLCAVFVLVLDVVRALFVAWLLPSIANRLRGYTPPSEGGPRG